MGGVLGGAVAGYAFAGTVEAAGVSFASLATSLGGSTSIATAVGSAATAAAAVGISVVGGFLGAAILGAIFFGASQAEIPSNEADLMRSLDNAIKSQNQIALEAKLTNEEDWERYQDRIDRVNQDVADQTGGPRGMGYDPNDPRGPWQEPEQVGAVRQAKAMFAEMRERLELARDAWAEAREEEQGHVSAGLAALRATAGRQAKELDPNEIKERLARIAGRELGKGHDHAPGQGARCIHSRLADVLGKARAADQEREKARVRQREQQIDEERKWQREIDRNLGWEL